jgi:hypothetical protein
MDSRCWVRGPHEAKLLWEVTADGGPVVHALAGDQHLLTQMIAAESLPADRGSPGLAESQIIDCPSVATGEV